MKVITAKVPEKLYREIHKYVPLPCVDIVVVAGKEFLLVKRKNKPEQDKWWLVGGRVLKNERLAEAALRKLKQETGLNGRVGKFLGIYEYFSKVGYFPGMNAHMIALDFVVHVNQKDRIRLDWQSSRFRWCRKIEPDLPPYVKEFLRPCRFSRVIDPAPEY